MPYDPTLTTDRDKARALLGDIATTELLTDAHYDAVLLLYGFNGGVAFLASELAATFAQLPTSVSNSGKAVAWAERVRAWQALATQMRSGGVVGPVSVAPYVGGISVVDKETVEEDTDRVLPAFTRERDMEPVETTEERRP